MNSWTILKKCVIEQLRDRRNLVLAILSPVFFVFIFAIFFGKGFYTLSLSVSNDDKGQLGNALVTMLQEQKFDNGSNIFNLSSISYDKEKLTGDLKKHNYAAHIYIPADFTQTVKDNKVGSKLVISGDPSYANYGFSEMYIEIFYNRFVNKEKGKESIALLEKNPVVKNKVSSEFDYMAPGFIVISVYFLMIITAMILGREWEQNTMQRLLFSKLKPWELYLGVTISQIILGTVMAIASFLVAIMMGFTSNGSLLIAFVVSLISNISAIGIGLIIAAFSRSSAQAFFIGNIVLTPLFFLAGIFLAPPEIKLFTMFGKQINLVSFIPCYHSVEAMRKVLINNASIGDIAFELVFLSGLTLVICVIGIVLFNSRYLKKLQA